MSHDAPAARAAAAETGALRLIGATHWTDLRGPAACELLTETEADARPGPDPLRRDADPDRSWARISRSQAPLATLLMDQAVLSGVGNVCCA